jgi:hypothetical protein
MKNDGGGAESHQALGSSLSPVTEGTFQSALCIQIKTWRCHCDSPSEYSLEIRVYWVTEPTNPLTSRKHLVKNGLKRHGEPSDSLHYLSKKGAFQLVMGATSVSPRSCSQCASDYNVVYVPQSQTACSFEFLVSEKIASLSNR